MSTDPEKAFDEVQQSFVTRNTRNRALLLQHDKSHIRKAPSEHHSSKRLI